jgi:hypothetical protein
LPGLLNMAMVRNFEIMLRQTLKNLCVELWNVVHHSFVNYLTCYY